MKLRSIIGASVVLMLGAGVALAQTPDEICKKPELRPQVKVDADQMNQLMESAQSYIDCMKPVIEAKRKLAQQTLESGQEQAKAVNATVAEVNAFIEEFRAYHLKHKGDK